MYVYNDVKTVYNNDLVIKKIKYIGDKSTSNSYIFMSNGYGDAYIDLNYNILYVRSSPTLDYTAIYMTDGYEYSFNSSYNFKVTSYPNDNSIYNYLFYSESINDSTTSLESITMIEMLSQIKCREKEQVRPTDLSQEWTDSGNVRDKEECDESETNSCECGMTYRWIEDGTICEGVNLHHRLKYQFLEKCNSTWTDYIPTLYKIGEVIQTDSSECGTYEYKEEWDSNEYCGSEINTMYGTTLTTTSKYRIKYPYIKKIDDFIWTKLDCETLLDYELIRDKSFECGWYTTRTRNTYDENLCGSEVKVKYPSLSDSVSDTNRYKITIKHYEKTAPYPTNTDDMTEDEWVWTETSTTYSYSTTISNDCECGYRSTTFKISDPIEYACGSELGGDYVSTTKYEKWYEWEYCPSTNTIYDKTGNFEWRVNTSNTCECGYREYEWRVSDPAEYICGSELNANNTFEIISTSGNWAREGNTFTSNDINDSENTIQRIYFKTNTSAIKFTINQSSENCCDYLVISNLDMAVVSGSPSSTGSSYNFYNYRNKTTGTTSMTISDNSEHFIELMFRKDGSISNGRDNVIVTIEGMSSYVDTTKYIKHYKWEYCPTDDTLDVRTDEIKWEVFENNSYDCGYKQYRWVDTGNEVCCGGIVDAENSCTEYYRYKEQIYQVTEDGTNWVNVTPERYRYGNIIETNSEQCGYIPKLVQWKLICPDITYETAVSGDTCTVCKSYLNAPTMYAIEKQQSSTDGGITWTDDYSNGELIIRTEKILKWKADKCGYTGDTFAWFVDKSSIVCDGTNQVGTYYFKVSSDNGVNWANVEGVEPEVRIIEPTNDDYSIDLNCQETTE